MGTPLYKGPFPEGGLEGGGNNWGGPNQRATWRWRSGQVGKEGKSQERAPKPKINKY